MQFFPALKMVRTRISKFFSICVYKQIRSQIISVSYMQTYFQNAKLKPRLKKKIQCSNLNVLMFLCSEHLQRSDVREINTYIHNKHQMELN